MTKKPQESLAALAARAFLGLAVALLLPVAAVRAQSGGRKFALVIGINRYPHLPAEKQLRWAVDDAGKARRMLIEEFGFPAANVTPLSDEQATRAGIIAALRHEAARVRAGDVFVLYYSGHGTLFPDSKSEVLDETQLIEQIVDGETRRLRRLLKPDKFDSAVCPSDTGGPNTSGKGWGNLILDDELFDLFSEFTSKGCEVVLFADSCYSATLGRGLSDGGVGVDYNGNDRPKLVEPRLALGRPWENVPVPRRQRARTRTRSDFGGRFIALTASRDHELAWESDRGGGFFTQALVTAAAGKGGGATFECLFRALRRHVKAQRGMQEPQMDTRFFRGEPTNVLFPDFTEPFRLKVLVKFIDAEGRGLAGASFALLRAGASQGVRLERHDALLLGRSDSGGLYDSGCPQVERGTYRVVAAKSGYRPFEQSVQIEANRPGVAVLLIKLTRR